MKKYIIFPIFILLSSCATTSNKATEKQLYEVLTQQETGGASIRFFEILSEEKEIQMLLSDENLKKKIKPSDINTSNFIILNLGEKSSGGYSVTIDKVEETATNIVVFVKEIAPDLSSPVTDLMTNPYAIVKINSKKEIIIK